MIKVVILDLDGVIIDTEPIWFETYSKVCQEYGRNFTEELDKLVKGRSNSYQKLTAVLGIPKKHLEFTEKVKSTYKILFQQKAKLMPGVLDLLYKLKKNYNLGLATSAYKYRVEYNLKKFPKLRLFFTAITSGDEVTNGKPDPDIFLLTAKKLNVLPKECLVIEDAETGVAAAKAAGMKVIGLNPGHVTPQNLSGADMVVTSLTEINPKSL